MMHEELYDFLNRRRSVGSLRWFLEEPDPPAPLPLTPLQEYLQKLLEMKMHIFVSSHSERIPQRSDWTYIYYSLLNDSLEYFILIGLMWHSVLKYFVRWLQNYIINCCLRILISWCYVSRITLHYFETKYFIFIYSFG